MTDAKSNAMCNSTTGAGAPAPSDPPSTAWPNGLLLLHDVDYLEQMARFNREKLPERKPHALMGERGLPRTWRHMNGYGSHTFMWVSAAGDMCRG